jgi:hypothetical protein
MEGYILYTKEFYFFSLIFLFQVRILSSSAWAKKRIATITYVMYVRPSIRPHGETRFSLTDFDYIDILVFLENL